MQNFTIRQDGAYYLVLSCPEDAFNHSEQLLAALPEGEEATFTVEDENGYLLASITNRRIEGVFVKETWKGNETIEIERVDFDATDYVLQLSEAEVRGLKDRRDSSDDLGRAHVSWDGPCEVEIEDAVMAFFGVNVLSGITAPAIEFAKNRLNVQPATVQTVELTVKVTIRVSHGADVTGFVDNLDYSVISSTEGVQVIDTEITSAD